MSHTYLQTAIATAPRCFTLQMPLRLLLLAALLFTTQSLRAQMQPIDLAAPPQEWQQVFDSLSGKDRIEAEFSERRVYPFRRFPLRTSGVMTYNKHTGFALNYSEGRGGNGDTVFIMPHGVYIARGGRAAEPVPQNATATTSLKVMPQLMDFAPQKLAEDFAASGQINEDGSWQFNLRPIIIGSMPGIQEIRMAGAGGLLSQLVLVRAANERSEITINTVRFPAPEEPESLEWPQGGTR